MDHGGCSGRKSRQLFYLALEPAWHNADSSGKMFLLEQQWEDGLWGNHPLYEWIQGLL